MKLLIVEDETKLARSLQGALQKAGHAVDLAGDREEALDYLRVYPYDLVVLDLSLPRRDGFEVLRSMRGRGLNAPVLVLTARDDTTSKVRGLDLGADDYLVKPFDLQELLARVRALLRRWGPERSGELKAGDLRLDPAGKKASRGGRRILLTAREYQLLELLLRNKNRAVSREIIYDHVWSSDFAGSLKIVDVHVSYLRSKIDDDFAPRLLRTVRGHGYVLQDGEESTHEPLP
jgi:DNA-binding response OmpR family regulator